MNMVNAKAMVSAPGFIWGQHGEAEYKQSGAGGGLHVKRAEEN